MNEEKKTEGAEQAAKAKAAPKKPTKKAGIIAGVVAAVVVVAGIGMFVWHEQPSFCGAICHTPMDAYYGTYAEGTADKYGRELDQEASDAMMARAHAAEGYGCLDCHEPTVGQQVSEGLAWVSGGYEVAGSSEDGTAYLATRDLDQLMEVRGEAGYEMCLTPECHDTALADLESLTADLGSADRNPHSTQHDAVPACSECHKAHEQPVNACTQCHNDSPVPEGWLTTSEANRLKK